MNAKRRPSMSLDEYEADLTDHFGKVEICEESFDSGEVLRKINFKLFKSWVEEYNVETWICSECNGMWDTEKEAEICCIPPLEY